jgi:hypothetical protein
VIGSWRQGKGCSDSGRYDLRHIRSVGGGVDPCARGGQAGQSGADDVDPFIVGVRFCGKREIALIGNAGIQDDGVSRVG